MRQLQKGNQAAQRSGCRRNLFSRVLILRTLRKTDHRVPEERQASSAQDDWITAPSDSAQNKGLQTNAVFIYFRPSFEWWREQFRQIMVEQFILLHSWTQA